MQKGKHALWAATSTRFLVAEFRPGLWMRTSGLTDAEKQLFLRRSKEPRTVAFAAELLGADMVVLDVGANIGYFSVIFASLVGRSGQVHSFEPTPVLAQRVRVNVSLNGFEHVRVNEVAVSNVSGTADLHISAEDPEANSLFQLESDTNDITVATTTLDAYVETADLSLVDLIKIDCEGSELSVLKGARSMLERGDGPMLLLECNPASLMGGGVTVLDLQNYLNDASYTCFTLEQLRKGSDPVWNILALKPSHRDAYRLVEKYSLDVFRGG